ncbi:sirohydrochlorin chelatase [Allocoleopsis sp.]|uniref:sirohydrochlorin chelatase n=1 Tax=Allocoleopsis sp. TaxID=3088169 RepID=UPI002FD350BE
MSFSSAYLLISHGSRDPRPQQAMEELAERVATQLGHREWRPGGQGGSKYTRPLISPISHLQPPKPSQELLLRTRDWSFQVEAKLVTARATMVSRTYYPLVGTATLELAEAPLHEQIRQFASAALAEGCNHLQLLPLFLLPGVHVREDIPTEVALAQQYLGKAVILNLRPHVGTHPGLGKLLASQWALVDVDAKILLSHGSRRIGGNEPVEVVAQQLGAVAAYWSVQPTLEEQVKVLVAAGHKRIGILPYFLFPGGITDAIAQRVGSLQAEFPKVRLNLGEPIGVSSELANLIVDLVEQ